MKVGPIDRRRRGDRRPPRFNVGDRVSFRFRGRVLSGEVEIVDYRGGAPRAYKGCDWSYDIFVEESPDFGGEPCLYKHIPGCDVASGRWLVTVMDADGVWRRVDVAADTMGDAVESALSLDWAENVVECERVD